MHIKSNIDHIIDRIFPDACEHLRDMGYNGRVAVHRFNLAHVYHVGGQVLTICAISMWVWLFHVQFMS